jgi:adenosylmethionine-8-amino-7-oxononanoate aminotransferase
VWLRPFNTMIYTMPPYIATDEEVAAIGAAVVAAAAAGSA